MNNQAPAQTKKTKKPNFFVRFLKRIMKRFVLAVWKMEDEIAEGESGRNYAPSDSDAEPKRDYSYRSAQMIDGNIFIYYNRVDWYINRAKGVIFEPGSMRINVPDGVSAYAAYKENNCKFSLAGTSSFSIPAGRYVVSFRAMKTEGVSCKLHIMAYDNGRKVELLRLSANGIMPLEIPEKYKNFRLALQCSGSGSMVIESIELSRQTFAAASAKHTDLSEIRISPAEDLWFYPSGSPYIKATKDEWIIDADAKNVFFSYQIQDLKFSKAPDITLPLQSERYRIGFGGEIDGTLVATLCIIPYVNGEKQFMWQIPINEKKYFLFPRNNRYRMIVKFEGKGVLRNAYITFDPQPGQNESVMRTIARNAERMKHELPAVSTKKPRVAVIFDEFTMGCFANEADYLLLDSNKWSFQLDQTPVDFLFVESAWHGNSGSWDNMVSDLPSREHSELPALIRYCNEKHIPTVFWCKEDPVNYEHFIDAARLFDYVYTTDADIVERYQGDVGHKRCYCLQFAANPELHNPIDRYTNKIGSLAFAGSWLDHRHEDRKTEMQTVLVPSLEYGLQVFDRNFNKMVSPNYRFPEAFTSHIIGSLPFSLMSAAYKMYDIFLNVNSVTTSTTMFARRVFELLACGTNVISGYSLGIDCTFGDLVAMCHSEEETRTALNLLQGSREYRDRLALRGIREVFSKHTYHQRFRMILENMGLLADTQEKPYRVHVVGFAADTEAQKALLAAFARQTQDKKYLTVYSDAAAPKAALPENVRIRPVSAFSADSLREIDADYCAVMTSDCYYGAQYLTDLLLSAVYSHAMLFGKQAYCVCDGKQVYVRDHLHEYTYTQTLCPDTLVFSYEVTNSIKLPPVRNSAPDWNMFLQSAASCGFVIFAADRFNFAPAQPPEFRPESDRIVSYSSDCCYDV